MKEHVSHTDLGKVLIIDKMHDSILSLKDSFEVEYNPGISPEEAIATGNQYDVIIVRSKLKVTADVLSQWGNVRLIARAGSGVDNIDVEYAEKMGIDIINCGEGNANAVAEHTLGMILNLCTKMQKGHKEVVSGEWDREGNRGIELSNQTLGIVGFGNTGSALARLLLGFGTKVLAYDKYKSNYTKDFPHVEEATLEELERQSDVISFHVPLTHETNQWISSAWLDRVKDEIILLNLSRGDIMNLNDVATALFSRKIKYLGLDVLPNEDINSWSAEDQELIRRMGETKRMILTPHVGGWTEESYRKISEILVKKIRRKWTNVSARNLKTGIN